MELLTNALVQGSWHKKLNHKIDQSVVYDCVSIANIQLSKNIFFSFLCFSTMHSKSNFLNVSSKQMVSSVATI